MIILADCLSLHNGQDNSERDEIIRAVAKIAVDVESAVLKRTEITQDRFDLFLDAPNLRLFRIY